LQTVRHRFNINASSCVSLAQWHCTELGTANLLHASASGAKTFFEQGGGGEKNKKIIFVLPPNSQASASTSNFNGSRNLYIFSHLTWTGGGAPNAWRFLGFTTEIIRF